MPTYFTKPIRPDFVHTARHRGLDDLQQPVVHLTAQGGEPCRDVLRRARPGEALILASYCPFSLKGPYREYGPVFILREPAESRASFLPPGAGDAYLQSDKPIVLRAYDAKETITDAILVATEELEREIDRLFHLSHTQFILLRFAAYGCYAARVDRI